uniref:mannose-6-phosphate isomerase n=1 Tax=Syphacia muris TaxID=451379 RepID=A0A0N5APE6_9BILA
MERLQCHVQNYVWGKKGVNSEVARVYAAGHDVKIDENLSYAELWMGTHPDGPAKIKGTNTELSKYIANTESSVYERSKQEMHLPFIMKLMSIAKTLSIQVHPTKEQAAVLNDSDPIHYPDRNHKPELAYALTKFELLCGFRPAQEICYNIAAFPELKELMGGESAEAFQVLIKAGIGSERDATKAALAECFKNLVKAAQNDPEKVAKLLKSLLDKFDKQERGCLSEETVQVIRKMAQDFPGDVGCFCPLILNHIILNPGECCYYAPREIHAYLSGECVECVGCSNNTIRAACTPKFIDIDALCNILNYHMAEPSYYIVPQQPLERFPHVVEYAPDCKDFTLHQIKISSHFDDSLVPLPRLTCGSIMVVVEGKGRIENSSEKSNSKELAVSRGDIIYIANGSQICFTECSEDILAYRTFSYEVGPDHSARNTVPVEKPTKLQPNLSSSMKHNASVRKNGRAKFLVVDGTAEIFDLETEMDGIC